MSNVVPLDPAGQVAPVAPSAAQDLPPQSIEAEQAVLGALLLNNSVYGQIASILEPEHFAEEIHARIYRCASELIKTGKIASPITLIGYLNNHELAPGISTRQYLATLVVEAVTVIAAPAFAATVRELADRRAMIAAALEIIQAARHAGPSVSSAAIASDGITTLHKIAVSEGRGDTRCDPGTSAAALITRAHQIINKEIIDDGVSTGIPDLDKDTGGFQPGTLWIIGGRPGQGKTILATGFALKVASKGLRDLQAGRPAAGAGLFELEVPENQLTARLLADLAYRPRHPIAFGSIMRGELSDDNLWCLEDAQKRLAQMPLAIDVASRLSVAEIALRVRAEKARMLKRGVRLGVIFIDYLKFIKATDRYRGNRVYEIGEISGALKELAKSENICIALLAQLNRQVAAHDRKDKRPTLVDLRDSGDLEADADVVAFIHREAYYIKQSPEFRNNDAGAYQAYLDCEHEVELILGKTRAGPTGTVKMWCDVGCSTFAAQARGGMA